MVRLFSQLLAGLTIAVMISTEIGNLMKLMLLVVQEFNSLVEIGRDALARTMVPLLR